MNRFLTISSCIVAVFFVVACKKKEGCLVPYADNFDVNAKVDDGSCTYTGKRIFWLSKYSSDSLEVLDDSTDLYFYIDDSLYAGNIMKNYDYLLAPPTECGVPKAITLETPLKQKEEDFRNVKVRNKSNQLIFEADVRFSSSYCHNTEVTPFQ